MSAYPQKRQRTSGSFSPASPPYHHEAVKSDRIKGLDKQPQTPLSPSPMSLSSQNNASFNFSTTSYPDTSPPSSLATSQPVSAGTHLQKNEESDKKDNAIMRDADVDTHMVDQPTADFIQNLDTSRSLEVPHYRRNNHDRCDRHSSEPRPKISERVHNDVFPLFKLCEYPHPVSRPHPSENLISLYRLDEVAASVARKDPITGEKINKLRKSYEGKVKALQLTGKNKAVSTHDEFTNMLLFPDEEWLNQKVLGKSVEDGFPSSILRKLDKAVQASPGPLPTKESEKWKSIIGTDEPPKSRTACDVIAKKPSQSSYNPLNSQITQSATRSVRPERAGKKRSYLDSSFRGYGEGFLDDDPIGSSAGEDNNQSGLSKKRRRKMGSGVSLGYRSDLSDPTDLQQEYGTSSSLGLGDRSNSLGVGLVGVGNSGF